jgi:hypothetical protein
MLAGRMIVRVALCSMAAMSWAFPARAAPCQEPSQIQLWWSPELPAAGQSLRLLAVSGESLEGTSLALVQGKTRALNTVGRGGPPFSAAAEVGDPTAGKARIELRRGDKVLACRELEVAASAKKVQRPAPEVGFWKSARAWETSTENLYAAWVEALFDAPPGETVSFRPLTPALRDPRRNFLYNHLGLREDDPKNRDALPAEPDCADLPYVLRSYFAWKLALPMAVRDCNRGTATSPPKCGEPFTNESPLEEAGPEGKGRSPSAPTGLRLIKQFFRKVANTAHSGSARTALDDAATDFYPVELSRAALRPGTVYADPYGHVLVLVKWVAQSPGKGGLLLAVDGQPDGSVGRKRFWEGTFLFANEKGAGPGWKAFRPLIRGGEGAPLAPLDNQALGKPAPGFARFALEQQNLAPDEFYARMSRLINPQGLEPKVAYEEMLAALVEQLETRVGSVDNGETYMKQTKDAVVPMPEGPKIFETVGPWEDYATPSRDMRLIIAMNVLQGLPERIVKRPALFRLEGRRPEQARQEIEGLAAARTKERTIEYKRTDGTAQRLTVAELMGRKSGFEMAYNPNDCVETRWGARPGEPESATCKRQAPADQRARMEEYRSWFRDARRPSR